MEPEIIENKTFKLLGCVYYGDPFHSSKEWTKENEIGLLWRRFMKLILAYSQLMSRISKSLHYGYELHIETPEYERSHRYYVMTGIEVINTYEIPLEMFLKVLPKTDYVIFTTKAMEGDKNLQEIYSHWIPEHGYEENYPYLLQGYGRNYTTLDDPESEIDWYIPIRKRA